MIMTRTQTARLQREANTSSFLTSATYANSVPFVLQIPEGKGKIIKVSDGDSMTVAFGDSPKDVIYRHSVR
jgi:hypothetical protein